MTEKKAREVKKYADDDSDEDDDENDDDADDADTDDPGRIRFKPAPIGSTGGDPAAAPKAAPDTLCAVSGGAFTIQACSGAF